VHLWCRPVELMQDVLHGRNFVSGLICTLKSKKPKNTKNFKTKPKNFSKKLGFPALNCNLYGSFKFVTL